MRSSLTRLWLALVLALLVSVPGVRCPGDDGDTGNNGPGTGGTDTGGNNGDGTGTGDTDPGGTGTGGGGGDVVLERSAAVVGVDPTAASPGAPIRVTAGAAVFPVDSATQVQIDFQTVQISRRISDTEVEVLVPNITSGVAVIAIVEGGKAPGDSMPVNVIPAVSERLVLNFVNNQAELVAIQPTSGGSAEGSQETGRRLSLDVLDAVTKQLLFTDALIHPTQGRHEIYDEPAPGNFVLRGEAPEAEATFVVKIPRFDRAVDIVFYDAVAELDLSTAAGRSGRIFLNQISVGG